MNKIKVPVILGPTAVGKTELCLVVAEALDMEIISCDSRQIYRFLDIGTAKPSHEERKRIQHRMIDIIDPSQLYSAYRYSCDVLDILRDTSRIKKACICGGTGMYFHSLQNGLGPQVASDPSSWAKYTRASQEHGPGYLHRRLQECDPESATRLHPNDLQRIVRALQVYDESGVALSRLQSTMSPPEDMEFLVIILTMPREQLYSRIDMRVDTMVRMGLWEEFCSLRNKGYSKTDPGMQGLGYREMFAVEQGICSLNDVAAKIKQNTRRYAKRQVTWFTNKTTGISIDMTKPHAAKTVIEKITGFLE